MTVPRTSSPTIVSGSLGLRRTNWEDSGHIREQARSIICELHDRYTTSNRTKVTMGGKTMQKLGDWDQKQVGMGSC